MLKKCSQIRCLACLVSFFSFGNLFQSSDSAFMRKILPSLSSSLSHAKKRATLQSDVMSIRRVGDPWCCSKVRVSSAVSPRPIPISRALLSRLISALIIDFSSLLVLLIERLKRTGSSASSEVVVDGS